MEQSPLPLRRHDPANPWKQLYQYFVEAEKNHRIVTSVSIQQHWPTGTYGSLAHAISRVFYAVDDQQQTDAFLR